MMGNWSKTGFLPYTKLRNSNGILKKSRENAKNFCFSSKPSPDMRPTDKPRTYTTGLFADAKEFLEGYYDRKLFRDTFCELRAGDLRENRMAP